MDAYGDVRRKLGGNTLPRPERLASHLVEPISRSGDRTLHRVLIGYRVHPGSNTGCWRSIPSSGASAHDIKKEGQDGHLGKKTLVIFSTVKFYFYSVNNPVLNQEPVLGTSGCVWTLFCG